MARYCIHTYISDSLASYIHTYIHIQVFSFGRHATPEDRAKAAKSANKKVLYILDFTCCNASINVLYVCMYVGEQGSQGVQALLQHHGAAERAHHHRRGRERRVRLAYIHTFYTHTYIHLHKQTNTITILNSHTYTFIHTYIHTHTGNLSYLTYIHLYIHECSGAKVKSKEVEYANASAAIKSDNNKTNLFFMYEQEITKLNRQIHYANKVNPIHTLTYIHTYIHNLLWCIECYCIFSNLRNDLCVILFCVCVQVIEFCRVLNQYYVKYITLFVQEYGLPSAYKTGTHIHLYIHIYTSYTYIHSFINCVCLWSGFADENQYIIALCLLIEQQKPLLEAEKKGNIYVCMYVGIALSVSYKLSDDNQTTLIDRHTYMNT